jgi:hypothetical protein
MKPEELPAERHEAPQDGGDSSQLETRRSALQRIVLGVAGVVAAGKDLFAQQRNAKAAPLRPPAAPTGAPPPKNAAKKPPIPFGAQEGDEAKEDPEAPKTSFNIPFEYAPGETEGKGMLASGILGPRELELMPFRHEIEARFQASEGKPKILVPLPRNLGDQRRLHTELQIVSEGTPWVYGEDYTVTVTHSEPDRNPFAVIHTRRKASPKELLTIIVDSWILHVKPGAMQGGDSVGSDITDEEESSWREQHAVREALPQNMVKAKENNPAFRKWRADAFKEGEHPFKGMKALLQNPRKHAPPRDLSKLRPEYRFPPGADDAKALDFWAADEDNGITIAEGFVIGDPKNPRGDARVWNPVFYGDQFIADPTAGTLSPDDGLHIALTVGRNNKKIEGYVHHRPDGPVTGPLIFDGKVLRHSVITPMSGQEGAFLAGIRPSKEISERAESLRKERGTLLAQTAQAHTEFLAARAERERQERERNEEPRKN